MTNARGPRPDDEALSDPEFEAFLCPDCGNWDTTYMSKSGAIGCHSCGIHPDLLHQPSPGGADAPKAVLPPGQCPPPWTRLT